jgi:hypothetical protein
MDTRGNRKAPGAGAALAALLLCLPAAGGAQTAISAKAGTLGGGVELTTRLGGWIDARFGLNAFSYSDRREASDIEYDADANLRTATALLDWHPGGHAFRLSGGLVYNDSEVHGKSLIPASGQYNIGGVQVPASLVGRLEGTIDFDPVVPYAGLGWSNALTTSGRVGFSFDLGVVWSGEGDVTLTPLLPAGSPLASGIPRQLLNAQLAKEEQDIEDDISDYDYYPVVSLGLSYRF